MESCWNILLARQIVNFLTADLEWIMSGNNGTMSADFAGFDGLLIAGMGKETAHVVCWLCWNDRMLFADFVDCHLGMDYVWGNDVRERCQGTMSGNDIKIQRIHTGMILDQYDGTVPWNDPYFKIHIFKIIGGL